MTQPLIPQTEAAWQRFVTDYAESLGWQWLHIGRTGKYQKVAAKGTLGKGWPDLLLIKGDRILAVECKGQDGKLSEEQKRVLSILTEVMPAVVVRPSDFAALADLLH